ncbi:MAG: hypothetical protein Q4P18_00540 [Methanobrevibacter sp.]|uniref:DNA replication complex subunit Gins51 n=1 Tax=Methanobrevibacter sp. TaxID=66852 RepID=UPI0026E07425|nr:hypothetical protein [Methanobrevibacter sp.]MDO5848010.1 hypothetical protein [Methanobrevibacter sp.]
MLRQIQKKERKSSTLARVEETFYQDIHKYLAKLRESVGTDFFADEYKLIKDTQMVATEICERREHKITDAAVVNIHRSYHLFTGKPKFDLIDTTPLNLTPEEEQFYFSLLDALKDHRNNISLSDFTEDEDGKNVKKRTFNTQADEAQKEIPLDVEVEEPKKDIETPVDESKGDETLDRLDEISNARVIKDEKREPIEKQINKQEDEEFKALYDDRNEFVDLESKKLAKESELVNLLIFDEIGPIVGVDEVCYGPFNPQDIVVMPKINAMIFVKNRKGRILKI